MSESDASVEAGWRRYFVKSSGSLQRDLAVYRDESLTDLMFAVTGDKQRGQIAAGDGAVLLTADVTKAMFRKVEYAKPDGAAVASMKKNSIINKKHMEVTLTDGTEWTVVKSGKLQQLCTVLDNDAPIVRADFTTLALKHRYPIEIADGVDEPLVVGLLWAINFAHLQRISGAGAAAAT